MQPDFVFFLFFDIVLIFLYNFRDLQYIQLVYSIYSNHVDISIWIYIYIQLYYTEENRGKCFEFPTLPAASSVATVLALMPDRPYSGHSLSVFT